MMKTSSPTRFYADPAVSLAISLIIFGSAVPMSKYLYVRRFQEVAHSFHASPLALKSGRILLEASPIHLDLAKVKEDLLSVSYSHRIH